MSVNLFRLKDYSGRLLGCLLFLFSVFLVGPCSVMGMTLLIKNSQLEDVFKVTRFLENTDKFLLMPLQGGASIPETDAYRDEVAQSFWWLLSSVLFGKEISDDYSLLIEDMNIIPGVLQLMELETAQLGGYTLNKFIFFSSSGNQWVIRIIMQSNTRLLRRKELVGVEILLNGSLYSIIFPEGDERFVKAICDPRVGLVAILGCIRSKEESAATGQQPPPPPPGAGANLLDCSRAYLQGSRSSVHYLDPASGQVLLLE